MAQTAPDDGMAPAQLSLTVPPHDDPLTVEVITGALPNGAELILVAPDGRIVGGVAFFGQLNPADEQYHQILLPRDALMEGETTLTGIVKTPEGDRPAGPDDLRGIRLLDQP
ncbi:hypothetical protein [Aestuariicoccus sp. MJ-SS9]|uniref:hypothetical protein n=1 Tax=Aestuariicoccus sp. MJ-SS9 TaxID=3079855 RepID=UPI00290D07DE|nr:hypothetical protein [Aestuariicoccus sp. MJ-SS9]MDU8909658.1 hypothetical protein [Aestuariicoccus sp. MJ-SS9]